MDIQTRIVRLFLLGFETGIGAGAIALVNYASLAGKLGLDAKTVKEYIGHFEDNFLITLVSKQHNKLTESIRSAKKVYFNDNGFLNLGINPERNFGTALENLVFTVLNSKGTNVTYLRENGEVDFLAENRLIQVVYSIEDDKTKERELKAFSEFRKPGQAALLITKETDDTIEDVEVLSFSRFVFTYFS